MYKYRVTKNIRSGKVAISLLMIAILLCALIYVTAPTDVAYAVLPQSYKQDVQKSDCEWWSAKEYLDLGTLSSTVKSWFDDKAYNFDKLESDPVVIAVIDTGINLNHELFTGKYDMYGYPAEEGSDWSYDVLLRDSYGNVVRQNTVPKSQHSYNAIDVTDDSGNGHGTHVAGIVAMLIHALNLEKYIKIMPIKASYKSTFVTSGFKNAVTYALDHGADVVNMSLSSDSDKFTVSPEQASRAVFVAAAGNEGKCSDGKNGKAYWPASSPNVIGVMNYEDSNGEIAMKGSSNYGLKYNLCAPGTEIYSAKAGTKDEYISLSGTSMASPIVSFAAALATLKYRALAGQEKMPNDIANMVRDSSRATINRNGAEYAVLDINVLASNAEIDFYAEIEFKDSTKISQQLGQIETIEVSLSVSPIIYQDQGEVTWYLDDNKLGKGFKISFKPQDKVATMKLKAVWSPPRVGTNLNNDKQVVAEAEIFVTYKVIDSENIKSLNSTVNTSEGEVYDFSACRIDVSYVFNINTENMSPEDIENIMWYVNGKFEYAGEQFTFVPETKGDYKIEIKINGLTTPVAVMRVWDNKEIAQSLEIYSIIAAAVIVAVVMSVLLVALLKRKSRNRNIEE